MLRSKILNFHTDEFRHSERRFCAVPSGLLATPVLYSQEGMYVPVHRSVIWFVCSDQENERRLSSSKSCYCSDTITSGRYSRSLPARSAYLAWVTQVWPTLCSSEHCKSISLCPCCFSTGAEILRYVISASARICPTAFYWGEDQMNWPCLMIAARTRPPHRLASSAYPELGCVRFAWRTSWPL